MRIEELREQVAGRVIAPAEDGWDAARLFHSGIGEPALIVRAASVADVAAAVRWASAEGVAVAVRGGGHSAWGTVAGGLTIDLGELTDIEIDGTLVRVGGGATWGAVAGTLSEAGLGVSSGDTASVGVGGLTLGGGIGWMVRAWGLAADQLTGVQLVTAAGDVVEVSAASHPELFWALRGGGGNFGVVTRFDYRAHELPAVVFGELSLQGDARPVLRALRDTLRGAPRELTVTYADVPAMDPSAPAGATITACWIGDDVDAARAALGPVLALSGVEVNDLGVRPYPDILLEMPEFDPNQPMPGFIGGNTLLTDADDDVLDALATFRESNPASVLFLRSLGGAYGDVPDDATAFSPRGATWFAMAGAFDLPGTTTEQRAAVEDEWARIEARGGGVYGNFTQAVDGSVVAKMYSPETSARLAKVKREWDPGNVFSRNHNVAPA
ncbi:MAG TPA: FAD-binding protein [Microbacterium sp.]|uniref:FAD-binding oxidoreductase n=1 Tax=Microbacterium sp. TaxID=51671 RepID=UPI002CD8A497|nr:FAD-binding protein [Microbacterium sp.]HWI32372.1 FAD-binding protein [Microbacterium sp.]